VTEVLHRETNVRRTPWTPRLPPSAWVRPQAQHLTLAFLGEQKDEAIGKFSPLVERSLNGVKKFEARLKDCGFFPNPRHARIGWAGVTPEESFRAMANAVRGARRESGVEFDQNECPPHLPIKPIRQ